MKELRCISGTQIDYGVKKTDLEYYIRVCFGNDFEHSDSGIMVLVMFNQNIVKRKIKIKIKVAKKWHRSMQKF
jgi:hypothetical protein